MSTAPDVHGSGEVSQSLIQINRDELDLSNLGRGSEGFERESCFGERNSPFSSS